MDIKIIFLFTTALIFASVGLYICKRAPKIFGNISYGLHVISVGSWSFGLAMFYRSGDAESSLFWAKFLYLAGSVVAGTFLYFSLSIFSDDSAKRKNILIFIPNLVLFFVFFFTAVILKQVAVFDGVKGFVYGPGHIIWDLVFDAQFLAAFFLLMSSYGQKTRSGLDKMRIRYILLATGVTLLLAGTTNVILPWANRFDLLWVGPGAAYLWLGCILYAITRYRLMDIKIVAIRTTIFLLIYTPILSIPFILGNLFSDILEVRFGKLWWMAPNILTVVLTIGGLYACFYIREKVERLIKAKKLKYLEAMSDFLEDVKTIRGLGEVMEMVLEKTTELVGVNYAGLYLLDKKGESYILKSEKKDPTIKMDEVKNPIPKDNALIKLLSKKMAPVVREELKFKSSDADALLLASAEKEMRRLGAEIAVPSFHHTTLIAAIILGEQASFEPYTDEDVEALTQLGVNVGLAIKNASFIEELNKSQAELLQENTRKRLNQMADGMSHQFNNRFISICFPAGIALEYIKVIDTSKMPEEYADKIKKVATALERVEENAYKGGDLAKGLLRLTRKDKQEFNMIDVSKGFELGAEMVGLKHKDFTKIAITRNIDPEIPLVWGNITYVQEMYFIMLENSFDAMRFKMADDPNFQGEIALTVRHDKSKNRIHIELKDNGEGMKPEHLDKANAFVPYFTTKASSETSGYGAGINMLKRFVEMLNGDIHYESEYDKGAIAVIDLPVAVDKSLQDEEEGHEND